jgi:hypothetical protein
MTRLRRVAGVAIAGLCAACGIFFPIDGYEGAAADGAADQLESQPPPDVQETADSRDGGPPGDAGDAPFSEAEAAVACPGHPNAIFCDDFDHGPFAANWKATASATWTNATLSLSDAQAWSQPYSMYALVFPEAGPPGAAATLAADAPMVPGKLRASYDLYVEALTNHSAEIALVDLDAGQHYYSFYLFVRPTDAVTPTFDLGEDSDLVDGGQQIFPVGAATAMLVGHWVRAILDLDLGATANFTLTVESPPGTSAVPLVQNVPITFQGATGVTARAGLDFILTPATCSFYVDDVVIEAE